MTAGLVAALLLVTPMRTAETVPSGVTMLHVGGGFALLRVDLPPLPVVPLMTGELELAHGLTDGIDLRGRYVTDLGLLHRLGPELRGRVLGVGDWSVALRLFPSAQIVGSARDDLDWGGDVSTAGGLVVTHRLGGLAITAELGATVEWLLFEHIDGQTHVDDVPYLAFVDLGFGLEWATDRDANLELRVELAIPTAPDDPFAVLGVHPRATFGGSFAP